MSEWVKVSERLPTEAERKVPGLREHAAVLAYDPTGGAGHGCYRVELVHPSWWNRKDAHGRDHYDGPTVSHWMPLPAPPTDGGRG